MYSQLLHGRSHEQDEKRENKEKGAKEAWRRAALCVIAEECSISSWCCCILFLVLHGVAVCNHEEESFNSLIIAAAPDGGSSLRCFPLSHRPPLQRKTSQRGRHLTEVDMDRGLSKEQVLESLGFLPTFLIW